MSTDSPIPVVDLGPASDAGIRDAGRQVREAFTNSGFCYLVNHGVPEEIIAAASRDALDFFHLPLAEKQKSAPKESVRGFNAIGRTTMYGAANPDYKEYYQIGLELPRDDPAVLAGQPLRGPNQWPRAVPSFRTSFMRYFDEVAACGQRLLGAVATSMGIAEDFFVGKYEKPLQRTQAVYYPPHPADVGDELYGVAPHTDYGCVTLLWQDEVGGLEILGRDDRWIEAPPIPGTLLVNIGDLLQRWSNDRYRSTPHRVTNRSGRERLAIATFYDPDYTAIVDPAEFGLEADATPRHEAVAAGDYIMGRISASQKSEAGGAAAARRQGRAR